MIKKLISVALIGALAKVVMDKLTAEDKDADLWAEATDEVKPGT